MSGTHKHRCPNQHCGHIWEHGNDNRGDTQAHTCQKCGSEQWGWHYGGHEPPPRSVSPDEHYAAFMQAFQELMEGKR